MVAYLLREEEWDKVVRVMERVDKVHAPNRLVGGDEELPEADRQLVADELGGELPVVPGRPGVGSDLVEQRDRDRELGLVVAHPGRGGGVALGQVLRRDPPPVRPIGLLLDVEEVEGEERVGHRPFLGLWEPVVHLHRTSVVVLVRDGEALEVLLQRLVLVDDERHVSRRTARRGGCR
jgi:hypothetical protein